ncbi:hypothetical protein BDW59DRAFT_156791 [Aspergillus cavernicola]|uniref:Survival Motor Neuron Gemin2-binding domain-containing protein n=1 Tax=Aspergillus cavernicola TaxID=176166 RepID=A0ABR4IZT5_9EURO
MGKNKSANRALTQEEIWDDSALVRSWDEAVEEYQLYHSIHAKGENVEDVLREAEAAAESEAGPAMSWAQVETEDDMADAEADVKRAAADTHVPTQQMDQPVKVKTALDTPQAPPMPHPVTSQGQDEGLKNLMMAWYYAGYYSALYEGQQKATQINKSS